MVSDDAEHSSVIWHHVLAIGYSPEYLTENADGIRQDFPRIPLPAKREDLIASAELGRRVAALLDTERAVAGVTAGSVEPVYRTLAVATHAEGKQFSEDDLRVTAGWGRGGKEGPTMPGRGRAEKREYSERELAAMRITTPSAQSGGHPSLGKEGNESPLGAETFDVYLNNLVYWRNVPERVWNYYIGGYQVVKKWLSYRELELLGRPLRIEEVEEVTNMVRRIAALILMETELNANYQTIKAQPFTWQP